MWDGNWILRKERMPTEDKPIAILIEKKNKRGMTIIENKPIKDWSELDNSITEEYNIVGWHYI